jgi:hypothetical protein
MNDKRKTIQWVMPLLIALSIGAAGADYEIDWYTVDGGGQMWITDGLCYELSGTMGQSDAGPAALSGGSFKLTGGFWPGTDVEPPVHGDCDCDGDVDLTDFDVFIDCMAGPDNGLGANCACCDLDGDADVDIADFAAFQQDFTG